MVYRLVALLGVSDAGSLRGLYKLCLADESKN